MITPAGHSYRGDKGWIGWPDAPEVEKLRRAWFDAPDAAARKQVAVALQKQWYIDAPQINIGQWMQPQAWRNDIQGVLPGFGVFWNVRRAT
jgi:peptide/nickel transport system substrate-binding protein